MIIFYSPDLAETMALPEEESAHCVRVLRMKVGERITVVDGRGNRFLCEITDANPRRVGVDIIQKDYAPDGRGRGITLVVAPTKNIDRIEWLLEKATELGVARIVLVKCARSERKNVNPDRLRKILISAMKQSLKTELPDLIAFPSFNEFITMQKDWAGLRVMGYCDEKFPRLSFVKEFRPGQDVNILIGPEGDFSPEEVELAVNAGYQPVTFGDTRLRTETAALYAVEAVHILYDLQ